MNVNHTPFDSTVAAAETVVRELTQARSEFVYFDRDSGTVLPLPECSAGQVPTLVNESVFQCSHSAPDLVLRLARWIESLPIRGAGRAKGFLFGGLIPLPGEHVVILAHGDMT